MINGQITEYEISEKVFMFSKKEENAKKNTEM